MEKQNPFNVSYDTETYLTGKLVGGYVPQSVADYLHLLSVYLGTSMQGTLQRIIKEWSQTQEPESAIIETLVDRALMEWIRRKELYPKDRIPDKFKLYLNELKRRLEKRKINPTTIREILIQVSKK